MSLFSARLPTVRQLQCFVAVAQENSFRRAAEAMAMSQPPLSRQIRALEDLLRVKLVERDTHRVCLTAAGEAFAHEAHALLVRLDRAVETAAANADDSEPRVRIGLTSVIDCSLIPQVDAALRGAGPSPRVEYAYSKVLAERVRSGLLDLAVVGDVTLGDTALTVRELCRDPLMAALPAGNPATALSGVRLEDLAGWPLFWFPRAENPTFYDRCEQVFVEEGYTPTRRPEPDDHNSLLARIAAGDGIALLPTSMRAAMRLGVAYRPLAGDLGTRLSVRISAIRRADETRPEVLRLADALSGPAAADGTAAPVRR